MSFNRSAKSRTTLESDSDIKNAVFGLLARREYSMKELITKLKPKCSDESHLENVLFSLQESGLYQ